MKLSIYYYRGITELEATLEKITLFCGLNFQGKSSIAGALSALLTGKALPDWMKKKDVAEFINTASGTGKIELSDDRGTSIISYPDCAYSTARNAYKSSEIAAGLLKPTEMDGKSRSGYFSELLKTEPTEEQLKNALSGSGMKKSQFDELWKNIKISGFDSALKVAETERTKLKGAWENVTGDNYGSIKAANWKPENLSEENPEKLAELRKERDTAIATIAIDDAEIFRLTDFADKIPLTTKIRDDLQTELLELKKQYSELKEPEILKASDIPCPHCNKPLNISSGKIIIGGKITPGMETESQKKHSDYLIKKSALNTKIENTTNAIATANADLKIQNDAKDKLSKPRNKTRDIAEIEAEITILENSQFANETFEKATDIQAKIEISDKLIQVLRPDGLRKTLLTEGLEKFNLKSKELCEIAKWPVVWLNDNLDIIYGQRDYRLLSESEKFRTDITIQVVCALVDGSDMVIIDGADILDPQGRNGLISVLKNIDIKSVVFMTIPEKEYTDLSAKLDKVGINNYWVEKGTLRK